MAAGIALWSSNPDRAVTESGQTKESWEEKGDRFIGARLEPVKNLNINIERL
jgi:hypothetical protein